MSQTPDIHAKAETLIEALPYFQRYAGRSFVVKYGGHAMGDPEAQRDFAEDVVLLKAVGINPVVVHGGGPQIGAMLEKLGVETTFVDGLRVTDKQTADVAEMVLSGAINKAIVGSIARAGGKAIGISGKDGGLVTAAKLQRTQKDPDSHIEKALDLGFVGEPSRVDTTIIETVTGAGMITVVAPIGVGEDGHTYNINADTVAAAIAGALGAERILYLTDIEGLLTDMDDPSSRISRIDLSGLAALTADGTISGGMIPKVQACIDAVEAGVGSAHMVDGRIPHVLLLELFTDLGIGTMVLPDGGVAADGRGVDGVAS